MAKRFRILLVLGMALRLAGQTPAAASVTPAIILLRATSSVPNDAERNYAQALTRRLSRWLNSMDITPTVVDDDQLTPQTVREAQVIILGYNPQPQPRTLAILKSHLKLGGKLIVFYGADPTLAQLMGFKLGNYLAAADNQGWSAMRFSETSGLAMPARVQQESRNIRPVYPADEKAKVIAVWEDSLGRPTPEPACVQGPAGFWVSHVLLDDGDTENKKHLLLGMLGTFVPSVWRTAAEAYVRNSGRIGRFTSLEDAVRKIQQEADGHPSDRRVTALLTQIRAARAEAEELLAKQRYPQAVQMAKTVNRYLVEAYAATQKPVAGEVCGVWEHDPAGLYPGNWDQTCAVLKAHGVTDLFVNMLWPGFADYPSERLPASATCRERGDQLAQCLAAAHKNGLRVHLWKVCWRLDGAPQELLQKFKDAGRLQMTDSGQTLNWLCPSNLENLRWEKDAVREAVSRYDLDGIHLDYVRYRDGRACYCPVCRADFEAYLGRKVRNWPADVMKAPLRSEYLRWRATRITRYVRDISKLVRDVKPTVRVSAAVYGKYPSCVDGVGQDWPAWVKNGYLDFVCPMNYTTDNDAFAALVRNQVALVGRRRVLPGIGVTATESQLDPVAVIEQINELHRAGAGGFVLFELNRTLEHEVLPMLRLGILAAPADTR